MRNVSIWLGLAAGAFGIGAAVLWFWSATVSPPPPGVGYGGIISPKDPFMKGLAKVATLNRWAAGLTGISALCGALAAIFGAVADR